jgi:hypothetical protein
VDREVVGIAGIDIGAYVGTDKEALVKEYPFVLRLAVGSGAFGVEVMEMEVPDFAGIGTAA